MRDAKIGILAVLLLLSACAGPTPAAPTLPAPVVPTGTFTPSPIPALSPPFISSPTLTATATPIPTATPTVTPSHSPTPTRTATATQTPRPTATPTPEIRSDTLRTIPGAECLPPDRPMESARLVRVIDGDTIEVALEG